MKLPEWGARPRFLYFCLLPFAFCLPRERLCLLPFSRVILLGVGEVSRQTSAAPAFSSESERVVIARLNLSSDPFRNRTLPWTVAATVSAVSLVALVLILAAYRDARADADAAERSVVVMRGQSAGLEQQALQIKQTIPPDQRKTLEAAHALVSRKGFSWSQLFSDLESALPGDVRVQRINVREVAEVGDQTRAELELTVLGRGSADVTGMITEMNSGGTFKATPLTENQKSGRGETGYEWVLRVSYVQRRRSPLIEQERAEVGEARPAGRNVEAGGAAKVE